MTVLLAGRQTTAGGERLNFEGPSDRDPKLPELDRCLFEAAGWLTIDQSVTISAGSPELQGRGGSTCDTPLRPG